MKVTLSLCKDAVNTYRQKGISGGKYLGSRFLTNSFISRGHDVQIINPLDVSEHAGEIFSKRTFNFSGCPGFYREETNSPLSGDVFFVYGLGEEEGLEVSQNFLRALYGLEKQYQHVLNSAESTSYEFKPKQKSLDLPWIPSFEIGSKLDLVSLIQFGEKIIAKPIMGFGGQGISFLDKVEDIDPIAEKGLSNFFYERFVPADEERRYVFLNNQNILRRVCKREGSPGRERNSSVDFIEGIPEEIETAKRIVSNIGMFFCAIDFRGNYLLEINGSGTGMAPPEGDSDTQKTFLYNLSGPVVKAVEEHVEGKK